MLFGATLGGLELRQSAGGDIRLTGRFPYGAEAELAPGHAEVIAPGAFEAGGEVHLLMQHDFAQPLASRAAGSLELRNTPYALELKARIDPATSWARDFLAAHRAGLVRGLSPGFRVAPDGERVERRGDGYLRTVTRAELVELSAVTRPAYPAAQIEARSWAPGRDAPDAGLMRAMQRWRL
jgi:HK97 family phage prohead protease